MAKGKVGSRRLAARGEARAEKSSAAEKVISVRRPMIIGLMIASFLLSALAIFQWTELVHAQQGGSTFCSIDATFNCVSVWESPFAKAIHRATRLPVAAWGLVWGLTALAGATLTFLGEKKEKPLSREVGALRLVAAIGLLVSIGLFIVTLTLGTFCITCLGTYALVIAYALFAWKVAPLSGTTKADLINGASLAGVMIAGAYLLLLYPGTNTPVEAPKILNTILENNKKTGPGPEKRPTGDILSDFLIQLPAQVQQNVAEALVDYRQAPVKSHAGHDVRRLVGDAKSPVQIVEWSDIRCSHCKAFSETMRSIQQSTAPDSFAVELRQFPLDGTCNPNVRKEMIDSTGVRCAAAKALICIEQTPGFREAQERMFEQQNNLTLEMVLTFGANAGMSPSELESCMGSAATEKSMKDDIDFAMLYGLEGTPLVVINGREAPSFEPFVYALVLASGDANAPGWNVLPKPPAHPPR